MMKINDLYRGTEVMRWHIVKTHQKQSIAEHSWMVAILSGELANILHPTVSTISRRGALLQYALFHDVDEIITGDIPSPFKKLITMDPQHQKNIMGQYSYVLEVPEPLKDIVKLADIAEAYKFIMVNANSAHADIVQHKLNNMYDSKLAELKEKYPDWDWPKAEGMLQVFWHGEEWTLDDYVAEDDISPLDVSALGGAAVASDSVQAEDGLSCGSCLHLDRVRSYCRQSRQAAIRWPSDPACGEFLPLVQDDE